MIFFLGILRHVYTCRIYTYQWELIKGEEGLSVIAAMLLKKMWGNVYWSVCVDFDIDDYP